jgi:hypothetical protein
VKFSLEFGISFDLKFSNVQSSIIRGTHTSFVEQEPVHALTDPRETKDFNSSKTEQHPHLINDVVTSILFHYNSPHNSYDLMHLRLVCKQWSRNVVSVCHQNWEELGEGGHVDPSILRCIEQVTSSVVERFYLLGWLFQGYGVDIQQDELPITVATFRNFSKTADEILKCVWKELRHAIFLAGGEWDVVPLESAEAQEIRKYLRNPEQQSIFENVKRLNLDRLGLIGVPFEIQLFPNLSHISLNKNNLKKIPYSIYFPKCETVSIDCACNQLTSVFIKFKHCNVKRLNLMCNEITKVTCYSSTLSELLLSENSLETMPSFAHCPNLTTITLDHNRIRNIGKEGFDKCPKLKQLHLNENSFPIIDGAAIHLPAVKVSVRVDVGFGNTLVIFFEKAPSRWIYPIDFKCESAAEWLGMVPVGVEFKFAIRGSQRNIRWELGDNRCVNFSKGGKLISFEGLRFPN